MTQKGYDPFSFGQVKVGKSAPAPAAAPGGRAPSPEDILFEEQPKAAPAKGKGAAPKAPTGAKAKGAKSLSRDTSWDPPGEVASNTMSAADFGAEILGEQASSAKPAAAPTPAPARAPVSRPAGRAPTPGGSTATATPPALVHTLAAAAAKAAAASAPPPAARQKPVSASAVPIAAPPRGAVVVVAPLVVFAGGEGLAAWLYFIQQNPVLAAIAAALGLLLAGVTRIALRR